MHTLLTTATEKVMTYRIGGVFVKVVLCKVWTVGDRDAVIDIDSKRRRWLQDR